MGLVSTSELLLRQILWCQGQAGEGRCWASLASWGAWESSVCQLLAAERHPRTPSLGTSRMSLCLLPAPCLRGCAPGDGDGGLARATALLCPVGWPHQGAVGPLHSATSTPPSSPSDNVDDPTGNFRGGPLTGWRVFLLLLCALLGIVVCAVVGAVVFQKRQDRNKRFY